MGRRLIRGRMIPSGFLPILVAALLAAMVHPVAADPTYPSSRDVRQARQQAEAAAREVDRISAVLATADARLEQAGIAAARKVEAYEGAVYLLGQARRKGAAAQRAHAQSAQEAEAASKEAAHLAIAAYRGGGELAAFSSVLGASGPKEMLQRAAMVEQLQRRKQAIMTRRADAEAAAQRHAADARQAVAEQQRATRAAEQAKASAAAQVAALRQHRQAIEADRRRLDIVLAEVRRHAGALAADRRAALEAVAAERARREAERRRHRTGPAISIGGGSIGGSRVDRVMSYARAQLGKPYEWAADGPDTFDCSGLTLRAWERVGVRLPHWSVAQYEQSRKVPLNRLRVGDMVFFAEDKSDYRTIYHVGLYAGDGQMIEAPYTGEEIRYSPIRRASLFGAARP